MVNRVVLVPTGVVAVVVWSLAGYPHVSAAAAAPAVFQGSAAATGVLLNVTVPGAPATDTPVDGGGPTAQVQVSSLGASAGYAAFPDPSQFVVSAPALARGMAAGGAGGLPPANLPDIPAYPFSVASDVSTTPSAQAGSGPYRISSASDADSSRATAAGGLSGDLLGRAARVQSQASTVSSDTGVVSRASSVLTGVDIGPLSIGYIESTAGQTLDPAGTITPLTDLTIGGMRIGGAPVEVSRQGFNAAGTVTPVSLDQNLTNLLKQSGISLSIVTAQTFPGRVVAPALRITAPFSFPAVPNVGQFNGTMTATVGFATAQLNGATTGEVSPAGSLSGSASPSSGPSPSTGVSGIDPAGPPVADLAAGPRPALPAGATTVGPGPDSVPRDVALSLSGGAADMRHTDGYDTRGLYLLLAVGALLALGLGHLISRPGARA
jgi:hypothetical protein